MFEKCLYFNSNALARSVTKVWTDAYKRFDLSPPHAFMVRLVLAQPGIFPRDLADELSLSRSTVTRFLDSLEKKGFISRKATGEDGREVRVFPTSKAKKIHVQLNETRQLLAEKMNALFGEQEILDVVNKLRDIKSTLETG